MNGDKGAGGAAGRVQWSGAEILAPEGGEAPFSVRRSATSMLPQAAPIGRVAERGRAIDDEA
ncbi:MAG: hypothetical protein AVDCRST_MAG26-2350 [uncultured Chloroflexia bacterium]|uniref:Uncharacterized protein n=1 Tax=uncultured Chloroflexia bacterium TaxID=1672391 RepID=A0A6J4IW05_9CHLR|nr:MAG: hypothetical protein AVDCRST_MAG26-2350 [uncultured Chloroflexia bacterium]